MCSISRERKSSIRGSIYVATGKLKHRGIPNSSRRYASSKTVNNALKDSSDNTEKDLDDTKLILHISESMTARLEQQISEIVAVVKNIQNAAGFEDSELYCSEVSGQSFASADSQHVSEERFLSRTDPNTGIRDVFDTSVLNSSSVHVERSCGTGSHASRVQF